MGNNVGNYKVERREMFVFYFCRYESCWRFFCGNSGDVVSLDFCNLSSGDRFGDICSFCYCCIFGDEFKIKCNKVFKI